MKSKKETGKSKKRRASLIGGLLLFTFSFFLFTSCGSRGGAVPIAAAFGYCPVCHMRVNASDEWTAEIQYRDGTKLMFESPADMLAFYVAPDSYGVDDAHKQRSNIEKVLVKDYQSKQAIDALQATFACKSRVEGPMGPDCLPFGSRETAEAFVAKNAGMLMSITEVTRDMVRDLRR